MKHRSFLILCFLGMCMPPSLCMAQSTQDTPAVIDGGNADRVHLRAGPSVQSKSLGLYFTGTELLCSSDPTQKWTKVVIGSQEGYVKSEYLRWGNDRESVQSKQPLAAIRAKNWVNLHSAPSEDASVEGKLYTGDVVTLLGETATQWYLVASRHVHGYIHSNYIDLRDQSVQDNSVDATIELSFEFGQLAFQYGDSFGNIMRKSKLVGYPFECLGPQEIYYYSMYDEAKAVEYCIGVGFDEHQRVDYVSLQGSGTVNKTIQYPITFDELTNQIGVSILPQVFITEGKVNTVCYLWECGSYCIQAMAWPLSIYNVNDLNVEAIDIYSSKRTPIQQITLTPVSNRN